MWNEKINGFPETEVTEAGANKLSVLELKNGIFTRGILMDIPRLKKMPYPDPETAIYPDDLEALGNEAEKQGRWEFLLTAAPLPAPGGTGLPLNPIATF